MVDTTLPISSSMFDGFCHLTGSFSNVIELLPHSITSTPLGQASLRHGCMTSPDSRHSLALLFTSPNFNLTSFHAIRLRSLTPSVPSIAGSHHVLSTWPLNLFPSGPSTPRLTIDQANNIFSLASECQALGIRLAKEFQVLSGLEAIHCNSIQGPVHETLTLGHSTQEAAYSVILWDDISEAEHEATTHCLHSEADAAWKEMHKVMYNHQLEYDRQLAAFLKEMETTLSTMRDQVWATTSAPPAPVDPHGHLISDADTTHHRLLPRVLHLQKMVPQARWGFPLHTKVRASWTLTKVLGRVIHQQSEKVDCPPSSAVSDNSVGSDGL